MSNVKVIWITGLSGSGKSTLAKELTSRIRSQGNAVVTLDGDELRQVFGAFVANEENHRRESRLALAFQYSHLCQLIAKQGVTVVIATISLFKEIHAWNRKNIPGYFEVYLKMPLQELRRRDPKGIYSKFYAGELTNVAGLDLLIDEPNASDWVLDFESSSTVEKIAQELMITLMQRNIQ